LTIHKAQSTETAAMSLLRLVSGSRAVLTSQTPPLRLAASSLGPRRSTLHPSPFVASVKSMSSVSRPSDQPLPPASADPEATPPKPVPAPDSDVVLDDGSKPDSPKALGGVPTIDAATSQSSPQNAPTENALASSSSHPSTPPPPASPGLPLAGHVTNLEQLTALMQQSYVRSKEAQSQVPDPTHILNLTAGGPTPPPESKPEEPSTTSMTPKQIVLELDKHIIGQKNAKRSVAVALRNRYRRHKLPPELKSEVMPKNILMIGPTGVGKTEIARRMAKLVDAPFLKVEATKFTEVGFHGRDVDMIIHDLVQASIQHCRLRRRKKMKAQIDKAVEDKILVLVAGVGDHRDSSWLDLLRKGALEHIHIDLEYTPKESAETPQGPNDPLFRLSKMLNAGNRRVEKKHITIKEARPLIEEMETDRLISSDDLVREAIKTAESDGIVFLDEIDKIVTPSDRRYYADASSEGVQRDLLPLVEGCTINTKFGNVETDHILFIASGAFHSVKPSDMLPELQGRLPIRVTLDALTEDDFYRILTETQNSFLSQQQALLKTEQVTLSFTNDAIREVARASAVANRNIENIGARRLHSVIERIMDELSFDAPDLAGQTVVIDAEKVRKSLSDLLKNVDLSRYIL